jgi:hypothetical protein
MLDEETVVVLAVMVDGEGRDGESAHLQRYAPRQDPLVPRRDLLGDSVVGVDADMGGLCGIDWYVLFFAEETYGTYVVEVVVGD